MTSTLMLRPVLHRIDLPIRARVLFCWVALLLVRVAEQSTSVLVSGGSATGVVPSVCKVLVSLADSLTPSSATDRLPEGGRRMTVSQADSFDVQ